MVERQRGRCNQGGPPPAPIGLGASTGDRYPPPPLFLDLAVLVMPSAGADQCRSPRRVAVFATAALSMTVGLLGCRGMGQKHPVSESQAQCQHYSREGAAAMELGNWRQAESLLRQALGASPTDADARAHLAETLWTRGEQAEAIDHMRSAVRIDPDDANAAVRYGEMLLATGRADMALSEAERALAMDREITAAWALRGRAYRDLGDADRALADLHQALKQDPRSREVLADVAAMYFVSGRRRRELTTLHRLRDTYVPGEEPLPLLEGEADAYLALGRPRQAADRLRLACDRDEPNAHLLCRLAQAEEAAGDPTLAKQIAERALAADANHAPAQELAARLGGRVVK